MQGSFVPCGLHTCALPVAQMCTISEALVFLFVVDFALFADDRAVLLFHL